MTVILNGNHDVYIVGFAHTTSIDRVEDAAKYYNKGASPDVYTFGRGFRILKLTKHGRTETIKEST